MKRLLAFSFLITLLLGLTQCKNNKQPAEPPLGLYLPDDLEATLWAESPMMYNPTNMDVDSKGRIWITEAVNYRSFNNDSVHHLHHSKGDRVMILEDRDGDGKADTSKVFVQDKDLTSPLGIAVIGNKVIVSCAPNLIVYTDENGDDIPDKKEILLTGFGGFDHDHSLHSTVAGPDGKWYFNTGNAGPHMVKDKAGFMLRSGSVYTGGTPYNTKNQSGLVSDDGKVWVGGLALRINPDGTGLKVLAHNFRNSYEVAVDSYGNFWQNDNDDQVLTCRTSWLMEGGNAGYFSNDGSRYWQADQRPGQDMFTAQWHQDDPDVMYVGDNSGAGAPTGIVMNEGDALGEKYCGMLLSADAGRNVIFGYKPLQKASGFELKGQRLNFITSLPDDNTHYVWNDSAANSNKKMWFRPSDVAIGTDGAIYVADWYDPVVGGHAMQDSTGYGRIYRIAPKNKKLKRPLYDFSTTEGQLQAMQSPAINVRGWAIDQLRQQGESVIPKVLPLLNASNPYYRARAVWLLSQLGNSGIAETEKILDNGDPQLRVAAFRALRETGKDVMPYCRKLVNDTSSMVRREVAIAIRDLPFDSTHQMILQLIKGYNGDDPWYLYALGLAVGQHGAELYPEIINALGKGSTSWNKKLADVLWRIHPAAAAGVFQQWAQDSSLTADARKTAITALAFVNDKTAVNAMLVLAKSPLQDVAEQSKYWLSFRKDNDWYALIDWKKTGLDLDKEKKYAAMKVWAGKALNKDLTLFDRKDALQHMANDSIGGQMIMGLLADNKFEPGLDTIIGKMIFKNPDLSVRVQADKYFAGRNDKAEFSINDVVALAGNAENGHVVFTSKCATCHRVNSEGHDIGPELTAIQKKLDKTALVDAIIHPSAAIEFGYEPWLVNMKDSTAVYGFIIADSKTVVVKDLAGVKHSLPKDEIKNRKKMDYSLMPEPAVLGLSANDIANVVAFIQAKK
ncbi:c-type cytochrome [Danxiaibacter flavus]|uniref:C-type cytochrome n=1 Tax=Danxiaibacter flavus TaxID=3049108 RepID=A0ABV3ZHM1_9BACT|nr:c-type cytochrome [Chitinophagaceae bacterium DXS]